MFAMHEISFLGHKISTQGLAPGPDKIQAIQQWPTPTSFTTLRAYSGLTGYYHHFVHFYAKIASSLTNILKLKTFQWSEAAQEAFQQLKSTMQDLIMLALPDFEFFSLYQQSLRHQCQPFSDLYPGLLHDMLIDLHPSSLDGDMLSDLVGRYPEYFIVSPRDLRGRVFWSFCGKSGKGGPNMKFGDTPSTPSVRWDYAQRNGASDAGARLSTPSVLETFGEVLSEKNEVPRAVVVPCVRYVGLNGLRPWIKSFMDVPSDKFGISGESMVRESASSVQSFGSGKLVDCELLYDCMLCAHGCWTGVGLRRVVLCVVGQDTQGGPVVPKAQRAVRICCRPQEGGPDVPRLGEWTRPTEGPVRADQSYCRLREWTRCIEGPERADQSHCRVDVLQETMARQRRDRTAPHVYVVM
uniref:Reverse transcriptase/retrotransposon-derived protein RNase H-like domain-containing protein n=1 Tax=Lactuca sativa TaxID=4236 RepID=A0A9R1VA27_LACSA|nr:hypothetical protein LSAT_V11C500277790 [Lactuca sativa]